MTEFLYNHWTTIKLLSECVAYGFLIGLIVEFVLTVYFFIKGE